MLKQATHTKPSTRTSCPAAKSRTQVAISLGLHAALVDLAQSEGRVLWRMIEDKLWELSPDSAPPEWRGKFEVAA